LESTVSASYHTSENPQTPNRGLLIDLSRFWEILEYSSASELLNGRLFGPSLYTDRKNAIHEVSNTASLPEPTRLGSASMGVSLDASVRDSSGGSRVAGAGIISSDNSVHAVVNRDLEASGSTSVGAGVGAGMADAISTGGGAGTEEPPLIYNDDELAVLAESLFDRRQDFTGQAQVWWNVGNL
jgi:hypothetical protein